MTALGLEIVAQTPSSVTVSVAGEVDMATSPQLSDFLQRFLDRDVTVDLAGVTFLDSTGLSALLATRSKLDGAGHSLRTVNEQDNVLTVLEITGLSQILRRDGKTGNNSQT